MVFAHIWIGLDTVSMSDMTEGVERELASSLVRPAKTAIIIEMSSNEGTARLAIDFAIKILTRWHAVLFDYNNRLLGIDDLRQMLKDEKEFDFVNEARAT